MGVFDVVNFIRAQVVNFWLAPKKDLRHVEGVTPLPPVSSASALDAHLAGAKPSILDEPSVLIEESAELADRGGIAVDSAFGHPLPIVFRLV